MYEGLDDHDCIHIIFFLTLLIPASSYYKGLPTSGFSMIFSTIFFIFTCIPLSLIFLRHFLNSSVYSICSYSQILSRSSGLEMQWILPVRTSSLERWICSIKSGVLRISIVSITSSNSDCNRFSLEKCFWTDYYGSCCGFVHISA